MAVESVEVEVESPYTGPTLSFTCLALPALAKTVQEIFDRKASKLVPKQCKRFLAAKLLNQLQGCARPRCFGVDSVACCID